MAQFTEKQAQIDRLRQAVIERYPQLWAEMIAGWKSAGGEDAAWLVFSANYLFRTAGIRWAIDPLSLHWRLPSAPQMNLKADLQCLSFVLLTHAHKDHLDLDLIAALADLPIVWVVPDFLSGLMQEQAQLRAEQMIIPQVLQPISLCGFTITPFESQHYISFPGGKTKGLPEMGYLVEQAGKRWLFPGDIRIYDAQRFPHFDNLDVLFAHLWLGHGAALSYDPGRVEAFCRFCADFHPARVVITHLQEFGRDADDFFDETHVAIIQQLFKSKYPNLNTSPGLMGEKIVL